MNHDIKFSNRSARERKPLSSVRCGHLQISVEMWFTSSTASGTPTKCRPGSHELAAAACTEPRCSATAIPHPAACLTTSTRSTRRTATAECRGMACVIVESVSLTALRLGRRDKMKKSANFRLQSMSSYHIAFVLFCSPDTERVDSAARAKPWTVHVCSTCEIAMFKRRI